MYKMIKQVHNGLSLHFYINKKYSMVNFPNPPRIISGEHYSTTCLALGEETLAHAYLTTNAPHNEVRRLVRCHDYILYN